MISERILDHLRETGQEPELMKRPQGFSRREMASEGHLEADHLAKAVLLKDSAGYVLAVVPGDRWVRIRSVGTDLGRELELAPEADIESLFPGCGFGSTPPFGGLFGVETVIDEALLSLGRVYVEVGDGSRLAIMTGEHLQQAMAGARRGHYSH